LELKEGIVVSHFGQGLAIESMDGEVILCHTRRQLGSVAVGDNVMWEALENNQGRVECILPRTSLLTRPAHGGRIRPVAANLDQLVVVVAPEPEPDWLLVDQYLAACEHRNLAISIAVNKIDQVKDRDSIESILSVYRKIGYACFALSAFTQEGLDGFRSSLKNKSSMLAGQSGVGKSSLTNALLPDKQIRTRQLSEKAGLGRHTTTTATLYHLPTGGHLIDSPGVAVFGLAEMSLKDLCHGYIEFREFASKCQFNDCRHLQDKGCAVRTAAEEGKISHERYDRYIKLLNKMHLI
jgi:ribosome biogenesis GTPase